MIITKITGGIGNQLFQYAAGRRLAYKLNTELKLDNSLRDVPHQMPFGLDKFNINATFATPEEIDSLKKINLMTQQNYFVAKVDKYYSLEEILNAPDNTYLQGWWISEAYFKDISDVLRKDLTLKEPLSPNAEAYKQKILSAECSVAMHFRHGDYVYNPYFKGRRGFAYIPPLERYCDCINFLKPIYKNLTVFVFSNNILFIKENLHLDVPIEFIENCANDVEELYLMSLCKHCIKPSSTFSWWASWLNQNPGKKTFQLNPSDAKTVETWKCPLSAEKKDLPMWIGVPFDKEHDLYDKIEMAPIFSLLLVMNNDAATIADTLDSLLAQDYKYHEIIIIDNASTDGSRTICRQKIEGRKNVTFKKLHTKAKNAKAWNTALSMAKGLYVSFLKGNDRFLANALTTLYYVTERRPDVIAPFVYLEENENGAIALADRKYSAIRDAQFPNERQGDILTKECQDAAKMLLNQQINSILSMKLFYRQFLEENKIKFDKLDDAKSELFFQLETFFKARFLYYTSKALYIAPKNN